MDNYYELLEQIRAVNFALIELNLYLDTHPSDENALKDHKILSETYERLVKQYPRPLTHKDAATDTCWLWINNPWPWDEAYGIGDNMKGGMSNVGV